jgi:peptidyl-prolyl cis-trans isomerase C
MSRMQRCWWAAPALVLSCLSASAQTPLAPPPASVVPAPAAAGIAARVNGQPIPETAVQRALERVPPAKKDEARKQILDFLIDNVLIDQYLLQLGQYGIDKAEIDKREEQVRSDLKKQNKDFGKMLEEMKLTEAELREQIAADAHWTNFCKAEATDAKVKQLFDSEKDVFDGTLVRARHILRTPPMNDPKAVEAETALLLDLKKKIEARVQAGMAALPMDTDNLTRETHRRELMDDAFADAAKVNSQCPSKAQGGDVDYFQRSGKMVEPFSKAAFALKPMQMSDVVQTQFGVHLILQTDRKPGLDVKFEEIKDDVREEYCDRMREHIVAQVKPRAKIEITPAPRTDTLPAPTPK